jgi:hypothetical protein
LRSAYAGDLIRALPFARWTGPLLVLALFAAVVVVGARWRRLGRFRLPPGRLAATLILLLWILVPLLALTWHNYYLQNYYFLYVFPVPFVLLALLADQGFTRLTPVLARRGGPTWTRWRWLPALAFAPLGLVALTQLAQDVLDQNQSAQGEVGRQRVLDVRSAIETGRALMARRPGCQFVVVSNGDQFDASRFGLMREFVAPGRVRFLAAG